LQVSVPTTTREKLAAASRSNQRLVLHIDGVQIPPDKGAVIKVYLNNSDATAATSTNVSNYVGSIVVVPSIARGSLQARPNVVRNVAFNLPADLVASLRTVQNVSVTLVPVEGQGVTPSDVSVGYRRVYLTQE
jgi:hypothetical protein